ncbi:DUF3793 family protein [uncultured Oscillibacter sp.]|uniref:DUF3793 family protein n=1 Tax=uncultured Oscillibacter sp. TaxID=876091 RepID=UPI002627BAB0|nr:DUF3793 family protein [uncultured Oscillibacter sp.]
MVNKDISRTFEAVLVRQCAPTLAGMKPGSIFCFNHSPLEVSRQKVCQWNKQLAPFGLTVQILLERPGSGSVIVFVYRHDCLEQMLSDDAYQRFLAEAGYERTNLDGLLEQLAQRLRTQPEFPHEIGVFLGYPLQDVIGFIENHGRNFTCCGFWKSYGDPAEMQVCFACYRRCIQTYVAMFEQGIPIERLAVPA